MDEILQETNFRKHKNRTLPIYQKYSFFDLKKANQILECASALWFHRKQHIITNEQKLSLAEMYTCKDRFCPFCNWRRQMKYSKLIYHFISDLEQKRPLRYIFLTLTIKNCKFDDLRATIEHMNKSFQRMQQTVKWKNSILGFLRVLEFTKGKTLEQTLHPHFHLLLAVEPSYFSNTNKYLTKNDFATMWQKALRVDYDPVVDVRIIKKNKDKNANASVIAEICKYPLKDTDILKFTNEQFKLVALQIKNVRNINAGGIFKGILKSTDKIDDDLVNINLDDDALWVTIEKLLYNYKFKDGKFDYYKEFN